MFKIKPQEKVIVTGYQIDVDGTTINWLFANDALSNIKWTDISCEPERGSYSFTLPEEELKQLYITLSKFIPEHDDYRSRVIMDKIIKSVYGGKES